jgi:tRNA(His) 5'-end guanylyltransferase
MLSGLSIDEKINLLKQESDIDFNKYHSVFRRGAACYRKSKINDNTKSQWVLNEDLPIFTQEQSFLKNIFI